MAVLAAVLLHDTTSGSIARAHPFAGIDFTPEVGRPVLAVPTLDATPVTKDTPPPAQTVPVKPSSAPSATPTPTSPPTRITRPPAKPPKMTLSIPVPAEGAFPVFYPDCETAWFFGAAPIGNDEPGYREQLDRDHDGIACELPR
ncbi:MAG: excalibur calcium-binding domain-containing protein [Kibdelosporangium sp.]